MRRVVTVVIFLASLCVAGSREPSHHFQGYYRGYLEQYAAAELSENANEAVAVIGGVKTPRTIEPREDLTLTKALDESGGFTDFADHRHVGIWKNGQGRFVAVNVHAIERKQVDDPVLHAGDVVIVTPRWMGGLEPQSPGKYTIVARAMAPSKSCEATVETNEWPDNKNTQVRLNFNNHEEDCGTPVAVWFDGLHSDLEVHWMGATILDVRYPKNISPNRDSSGELIQCYDRKIHVVLSER
jgi:hypothetical protein